MVLKSVDTPFATLPPVDEGDLLRVAALTPREREVLCLVGRGFTNREIAEVLVVEESTAKCHVTRVLTKTGTRNRVEAAILALCCGLLGSWVRPAS